MKKKPVEFYHNRKAPPFEAYVNDANFESETNFGAHYHRGYELVYFLEGECRITIRDKDFFATAGDLAVYRPDVPHDEYVRAGPYRVICLRFNPERVAIPLPDETEVPPVVSLKHRGEFRELFENIVEENQRGDRWTSVLVGALLVEFAVLLWRSIEEEKSSGHLRTESSRRLEAVIDLIDANFDTVIPLKGLASKAFMSESHFSHVFKDKTGIPPKQYVILRKIEQAKKLLATTDKSVTAIAIQVGYDNPQYFSRLFKKTTGQTPGAYRKMAGR